MEGAGSRDLIIGLANLAFDQAEPFIASLAETSYSGVVCFLVHDVPALETELFQERGILVVDMSEFVSVNRHMMNSRFFAALAFLARTSGQFDRVMVTDVRDVLFQSNPFDLLGNSSLVYACEQALIRNCPINGAWVYQAYGFGVLQNIQDYPVCCAGTTIGTAQGIMQYLTRMIDEMSMCSILHVNIDQGIHNYVAHMRPIEGAYVDRSDAVIATLNHTADDVITATSDGVWVGAVRPAVIHQWDRRSKVANYVMARVSRSRECPRPARFGLITGAHVYGTGGLEPSGSVCSHPDVIVLYAAKRDVTFLGECLDSIRNTSFSGQIVVCVRSGTAVPPDVLATQVQVLDFWVTDDICDANAAHLCFTRLVPHLTARRVVAVANVRCKFQANPMQYVSSTLSLAAEGATPIRACSVNMQWLKHFGPQKAATLDRQIVSSEFVAGPMQQVRAFYSDLGFLENAEALLSEDKVIQGRFQLEAYERRGDVVVHPNGSVTFNRFWPTEMEVLHSSKMRVGGVLPSIVMEAFPHYEVAD